MRHVKTPRHYYQCAQFYIYGKTSSIANARKKTGAKRKVKNANLTLQEVFLSRLPEGRGKEKRKKEKRKKEKERGRKRKRKKEKERERKGKKEKERERKRKKEKEAERQKGRVGDISFFVAP